MSGAYRTALVTGATSGIGRAVAIALARAGLAVRAVGRDRDALDALQVECGATPVVLDVRDREGLSAIMSDQTIDVLVSNAGVLPTRDPFQAIDPAAIDVMVETNFAAPIHLARLALPPMIRQGSR